MKKRKIRGFKKTSTNLMMGTNKFDAFLILKFHKIRKYYIQQRQFIKLVFLIKKFLYKKKKINFQL